VSAGTLSVSAGVGEPPPIAELRIERLAAGGDGVGRLEGLVTFVPRAAVGDLLRIRVTAHGRLARGRIMAVLEPSRDRVSAPCAHYALDGCGGCQWQHLALDAQRTAKSAIVVDAFARIAGISVPPPIVHGDAQAFEYRRTIRFTMRESARGRIGGFHAADDPDVIVPITQCLLAHPELQAVWAQVRARLDDLPLLSTGAPARASSGSPPRGARRRTHDRRRGVAGAPSLRITLRRLDAGGVVIAVDGGLRWPSARRRAFVAGLAPLVGVWWVPEAGTPRLVWSARGASSIASAPPDGLGDTETAEVEATAHADELAVAASFVQVNAGLADTLHRVVRDLVLEAQPRRVVDAYAGAGRLARALDAAGVSVTAIERDPAACRFAARGLGSASRILPGVVEARLTEALPADVVVLNPPRGGCDVRVCDQLGAALRGADAPRRLVYVSCDPATLARDVRRLTGWRVASVTCFDLFPQTAHVETVCVLQPEGA
jgi:23S rRNA (uracil1939-C5)-methyltransferase